MNLFVRRSTLALALVAPLACGDDASGPRGPLALAITSAPDSLLRSEHPRVIGGVIDAEGNAVRGQALSFRSLDEGVLTVDTRGNVTATGLGSTRVIVTSGALEDTTEVITVYATYRTEIGAAEPVVLSNGETTTLSVTMLDDVDDEVGGRTFTWSSSDTAVASIGPGGMVTWRGPGAGWLRVASTAPDGTTTGDSIEVQGTLAYRAIHRGSGVTCGISTDREAFCWGYGGLGALGTGDLANRTKPTRVAGGIRWATLALGSGHSCGIAWEADGDGPAYCWGTNDAGSIGNGEMTGVFTTPQAVLGGLQFVEIGAGFTNSCGRTAAGEIWCWGRGHHGQLGDGTVRPGTATPVRAAPGRSFARMAVGTHHAVCGVQAGGLTWCWGHNDAYQVARAPLADNQPVVDTITGGVRLASASVAHFHGCGLLGDGRAACWGGRFNPTAVGDTTTGFDGRADARPIDSDLRFVQLSARFNDSCAITAEGKLYCWGGELAPSAQPMTTTNDVRLTTIEVGGAGACGMGTDGRAYCLSGQRGSVQLEPVPYQP